MLSAEFNEFYEQRVCEQNNQNKNSDDIDHKSRLNPADFKGLTCIS